MRALGTKRWSRAEERTVELIACIQPNQLSEERRNAVAEYVQRLIMKCFPCQVCTFGSVPLKTYLPDGDINLTAFSHDQNLKDTWANQVRYMLQNEEKNENAEFHVKEVQYIQAEVSQHWRSLFLSSGFSPVTFSNFTESQAECVVKRTPVQGFQVEKRQSSLVLCWQRKELVSASIWRY